MHTLVIGDSNVFIDLISADLVVPFFKLPLRIATPDLVYHQELERMHADLIAAGLEILTLSPEEVDLAAKMSALHPRPGRLDIIALALAASRKACLLTGDWDLRNAARELGIEVHGTLWVVELMVQEKLIGGSAMRHRYDLMRQAGRRLPWDEVEKQIRKLES